VLEAAEHHRRQQHERIAEGLGQQERHDGQLGHAELQVAHDTREGGRWRWDVGELQRHAG
jgi:hypothetical protein